jgi:hypothetical protein
MIGEVLSLTLNACVIRPPDNSPSSRKTSSIYPTEIVLVTFCYIRQVAGQSLENDNREEWNV